MPTAPRITSVSPTSIAASTATSITISGSFPDTSGIKVFFGSSQGTSVSATSTSVVVLSPRLSSGTTSVKVQNMWGQTSNTMNVTVGSGSAIQPTTTTTVAAAAAAATGSTATPSDTQKSQMCKVLSGGNDYNYQMCMMLDLAQVTSRYNEIVKPANLSITGVSPQQAVASSTTVSRPFNISVNGNGFVNISKVTAETGGVTKTLGYYVANSSQMDIRDAKSDVPGSMYFVITRSDGQTANFSITITNAPEVTSYGEKEYTVTIAPAPTPAPAPQKAPSSITADPSMVTEGVGAWVTIRGLDFSSGVRASIDGASGTTGISVSNVTPNSIINSMWSFRTYIPPEATKDVRTYPPSVTVRVTNSGGTGTVYITVKPVVLSTTAAQMMANAPLISSVYPTSITAGSDTQISVTGIDFGNQGNVKIRLSGSSTEYPLGTNRQVSGTSWTYYAIIPGYLIPRETTISVWVVNPVKSNEQTLTVTKKPEITLPSPSPSPSDEIAKAKAEAAKPEETQVEKTVGDDATTTESIKIDQLTLANVISLAGGLKVPRTGGTVVIEVPIRYDVKVTDNKTGVSSSPSGKTKRVRLLANSDPSVGEVSGVDLYSNQNKTTRISVKIPSAESGKTSYRVSIEAA